MDSAHSYGSCRRASRKFDMNIRFCAYTQAFPACLKPDTNLDYHPRMKRRGRGKLEDAGALLDALLRRLGKPEQAMLTRLWQHWSMVMGPDLAGLAWPLGHRNGALLVGGEDAMAMQELSLMADEILERANAFMGERFFATVKVSLALGKNPLDTALAPPRATPPLLESGPPLSGAYLASMPADSAVARAYARYVALNAQRQQQLK